MTRVVFGCVPDTDDDVTRGLLQKLCSILGAAVGLSVEPRVAASPQALAEELAAGQVDVAWTSPTLLLTSNELRAATPLVCSVRGGMTLYHGVVFVRESSPYKSTVDLKGAHAAWVSETSASGYIFARLALASYGLDPRSLFDPKRFTAPTATWRGRCSRGRPTRAACTRCFRTATRCDRWCELRSWMP